jgi:arabinan endo-1,5-alpha-L-arabinosidase
MRTSFDSADLDFHGLGGSATPVARAPEPRTYVNPVLDSDFPDPTVIHAPDGYYYAYATQTWRDERWINIQVARSADLVDWEHLGDALPGKPSWASTTQDFWAPHVIYDGSTYFMYYSASPNEDADAPLEERSHYLAVATSASPTGPFVDMGRPLLAGNGFDNIDPMAYDDPATGKRLLYWGSGFRPIKVQELGPDRMSFAPGSEPTDLIWPNPVKGAFPRLVEASWLIHRDDFHYLFYSGDNCCGPEAEYGVMVARSRSATGPFETLEQAKGVPYSLMLHKSDSWLAPGHNSIATDAAGQDWIVYHAIDVNRPRETQDHEINSRRIMLIDRIEWRDGWPFVGTPSDEPRSVPITG